MIAAGAAEMPAEVLGARRIVVVGGGYTAATLAVQLVRSTPVPLELLVIEPRDEIGRGLAYSTGDPEHRLNGPMDSHGLDPSRPDELRRWCRETGVFDRDPGCFAPNGHVFLRRSDLGAYASDTIAQHAVDARSGSRIVHVRDIAISVMRTNGRYRVRTRHHGDLGAQMLFIATGNAEPSLPPPFPPESRSHRSVVANPYGSDGLGDVPANARALVVGAGLTSLDVVSTLLKAGRCSEILVVSRRGLRPCQHAPVILGSSPIPSDDPMKLPNPDAAIPPFLEREPPKVLCWSKALRREVDRVAGAGGTWHEPFDAVRDAVRKLWPLLPVHEQRRFLRRLRPLYDVHRFRAPPMNDRAVRLAEAQGRVRFATATLVSVEARPGSRTVGIEMIEAVTNERTHRTFDLVVNCTGLDSSNWRSNPVLASLAEQRMLRPHVNGWGFDVGSKCEARDGRGDLQPTLRVLGPPSAGAFGDSVAIVFIAAQVRRMIPDLTRTLESLHPYEPAASTRPFSSIFE